MEVESVKPEHPIEALSTRRRPCGHEDYEKEDRGKEILSTTILEISAVTDQPDTGEMEGGSEVTKVKSV